ncbi:MAG: 30S ribosomal protein S11 [Bacteroidota bacterium]|nr:30S ribosomal protein S11 [Bacteroidota bacterium]
MAKKGGAARTATKKRKVHVDAYGKISIQATFNNIIVTIANGSGQVISWASSGKMGFKGSKKNTPYAAQVAASECGKVAYDLGMRRADVNVKGPGSGREAAIRTLANLGIEIATIHDLTPIPHNGCRPPKRRRV